MLNHYARVGLAILLSQASAYDPIAGYIPGTDVLDHGNIDLDQAALEKSIGGKTVAAFEEGKAIYENGGNSKSVATITFDAATTSDIAKNTVFSGVGVGGTVVTATAYDTYLTGATSIVLKYSPGTCLVGSLANVTVTDGCFVLDGTVTDGKTSRDYTYALTDNKAKRTLKGFSTAVESKMSGETHANYFKDFYGVYDYADQIVTAAFDGISTIMPSFNSDYSVIGFDGREQIIKKGIVYMNVFMYAMHEFEASVEKCVPGVAFDQEQAVHAWDEGVAFFVGNLAGSTGEDNGKLVYALGNKRCKDFGTCGASGTEKVGLGKVNIDLTALFNSGRDELNAGDCVAATATKDTIEDLMYIPIIQGTLKYAYKGENGGDEKTVAEGTAFGLAVVGRINAASAKSARTIFNNMRPGVTTISASAVKDAFESVYDKLNISCEDVGGLIDKETGTYYPGMEPCVTVKTCTDRARGPKSDFTDPSSKLNGDCGDLGVLSDGMKKVFCSEGASAICPDTCAGSCGCTDDPASSFVTGTGEEYTCDDFRKVLNHKKNQICKTNKVARQACRATCQGFCPTRPFSKFNENEDESPTKSPVSSPTAPTGNDPTSAPAGGPVSLDDD
eukprot:CAMPEP_0198261400 /NCGR_PEP_ID=MMETSP1447-20131203/10124_1 /TAXON_ID=420782 /ORGANISM="Chaetoceros dichaeta, Strain CCMP1751" /LENGTH=615 /DNA_ID=CAMNT_0043949307 /DNA_START=92 /DNA_END=1939 /DNA_ORIENTATION=+